MTVAVRGERRCGWCGGSLADAGRSWCSKKCRQTAWRVRQAFGVAVVHNDDTVLRLAYADPPYPGLAKKHYGKEASYGGEVDHVALVKQLRTYDGWALSTSRNGLPGVLALCPSGIVVCPWVKTHHQPDCYGPSNIHEYLIVKPGRVRRPGPRDAFVGAVPKGGDSDLMGRKPLKFVAWVFELLGAGPQDSLDDLFPGSGIVGRCWSEFRRVAPADSDAAADGDEKGLVAMGDGLPGV